MKELSARPLRFGMAMSLLYALLLLPMAASRGFDPSVFILAGDQYVSPARLPAPIPLRANSFGYDGQFFYRLALDPWSFQRTDFGVTLDAPAKRMQRIVYPALAWLVSLGRAGLVPAALLAVNLAGLGVIAGAASWLRRVLGLAWWLPWAIMAWPGFLVALTHDTAEITATALLLVALGCYFSGRFAAYAALAAAAALARETTLPVWFALAVAEAYNAATSSRPHRRLGRVALAALVFVPFAIWWETLRLVWRSAPQSLANSPDLGWPLVGVATSVVANIVGGPIGRAIPAEGAFPRAFVAATTGGIVGFSLVVLWRVPGLSRAPGLVGLVGGWLLLLGLMSLMTANGPWVDPHAYFRAFTECWVIGCVLLAIPPAAHPTDRALTWMVAAAIMVNATTWVWSFRVLP